MRPTKGASFLAGTALALIQAQHAPLHEFDATLQRVKEAYEKFQAEGAGETLQQQVEAELFKQNIAPGPSLPAWNELVKKLAKNPAAAAAATRSARRAGSRG